MTNELKNLSLEELHARKEFNLLLMRLGSKSATVEEFNEINDLLLLEINARLNTVKGNK